MTTRPSPRRAASSPAFVLGLAALLAACGATASDDPAMEGSGEVVSAEDALTAEEATEGAAWDGEHDELTPEEEAELALESDPTNDPGPPADAAPSSLRPLAGSGCAASTGYSGGRAVRICTTTVNGKPVEVSTAKAFVRMRDDAKRDGVTIIVVSGFRTMAKQRELYRMYKAGRGNLAAPPGYSNHQSGHALDLNTKARGVYAWLSRNGAKYGFRRTVPSEAWHWERR